LERFNSTSKELQKVNIDLGIVVKLYKSLINFITSIRNDKCFNEYVILAKKIKNEEYEFDKVRTKKRKLKADETRENEVYMTGSDNLKIETYFTRYIYTNTFDKYDFFD